MMYNTMNNLLTRRKETSQTEKEIPFEYYPVCTSRFGSFPCYRPSKKSMDNIAKSDFDKEVGVGIILYFKQLKNFIYLLLLLTVLNLPLLILNVNWGTSINTAKASSRLYID